MDSKKREQSLSVQAPGQTHSGLDSWGLFDFVFILFFSFHYKGDAEVNVVSLLCWGEGEEKKKILHNDSVHRLPGSALFAVL